MTVQALHPERSKKTLRNINPKVGPRGPGAAAPAGEEAAGLVAEAAGGRYAAAERRLAGGHGAPNT